MIADTSLDAFNSIEDLAGRQALVLEYIRKHPDQTAEQICSGLHAKSPNTVAPRITELLHEQQAIYISGRSKTSLGRTARTYRAYLKGGML